MNIVTEVIFFIAAKIVQVTSQCYSNGPSNLGNLGSNSEIQAELPVLLNFFGGSNLKKSSRTNPESVIRNDHDKNNECDRPTCDPTTGSEFSVVYQVFNDTWQQ